MNNKIHKEENVDQIIISIQKVGFRDPVEVDEKFEILSGHGRVLAAKKMGIETIPVIQYMDMTKEQKQFYRIATNRIADFSAYNFENLKLELEELNDQDLFRFFDEFEMNFFEEGYDTENEDVAPIPQDNIPLVQEGDLFQLGNHFLFCGDATKYESYETLLKDQKAQIVFTDPPYNVNYKGQGKKTKQGILNDRMSASSFDTFLQSAFSNILLSCMKDCPLYIFHSQKTQQNFEKSLNHNGFQIISQLIRNKPSINHVGADYKQKHEPFFYASNGDPKRYGDIYQPTVIDTRDGIQPEKLLQIFKNFIKAEQEGKSTIRSIQRHNTQDYVHPTQKPVALPELALQNSSKSFDIVLDPFLGSGTTLIACEKKQRRCYGMELDPKYVEVIIKRYRDFTKQNTVIKCLNRKLDIQAVIDNV